MELWDHSYVTLFKRKTRLWKKTIVHQIGKSTKWMMILLAMDLGTICSNHIKKIQNSNTLKYMHDIIVLVV